MATKPIEESKYGEWTKSDLSAEHQGIVQNESSPGIRIYIYFSATEPTEDAGIVLGCVNGDRWKPCTVQDGEFLWHRATRPFQDYEFAGIRLG